MVNQSSLTGEALPVHKGISSYVYAGTVLEEGEFTIKVRHTSGATRYEKIIAMIEESEKLKSSLEGKAARLADRLVPYTLAGTGLTCVVWFPSASVTGTSSFFKYVIMTMPYADGLSKLFKLMDTGNAVTLEEAHSCLPPSAVTSMTSAFPPM